MESNRPEFGVAFTPPRVEDYVAQEHSILCDLLDEGVERYLSDLDNEDTNVAAFVGNLLRYYDATVANDIDAFSAAYNSFRTTFLIAHSAMPYSPVFEIATVLNEDGDESTMLSNLLQKAHVVMGSSPYLDGIVARYNQVIDPSGLYPELVDLFAGYALVFIDEGERQRAIDIAAETLVSKLERWGC